MEMRRGAIPQESPLGVPGVHPVPVPTPVPLREERPRETVPAIGRARLRVAAGAHA
jgi:hypothetical protein